MEIHPVTTDRLGDLADLFDSNGTTRGCWCMYFIATRQDYAAGWRGGGNRRAFERLAEDADPPLGLLAYQDGTPVGWSAFGPRSRYPRTISSRATILKGRDEREDDDVWLVPCFFVRVGHRRQGATTQLLEAVVDVAREHGAKAVEGFPLVDDAPNTDGYLGRESVFAACGFTCVARPTLRRAVMRRDL